MQAIVKRAIERGLQARGISHKQALIMVSVLAALFRDMEEARDAVNRATGLAGRVRTLFGLPRG
ncbi:hypothetical protein [Humidesulfovibrio sp.]